MSKYKIKIFINSNPLYDLDNITFQPKKQNKIRTRAFGALTGV